MRNSMKFLTAATMMACAAFAQEQSESVDGVLKDLDSRQGAAAQPAAQAPAMMEDQAADIDVPAVIEESRDAYVGGEFEKAQRGFAAVIKVDPTNPTALTYMRKLLERDARSTEICAMKEVSAAWDTSLVLRSYDVSAEAAEKMELSADKGAVDISAKFPEVTFPEGASAIYQPKLEKMFIRNTRSNLQIIEEVIGAMDLAQVASDIEQVEIEAKFVEVSEGTLEELGFEWQTVIGNDISIADGISIPAGQYLYNNVLRGGPSGPAMPFNQPNTLGDGSTGATGDWTSFRVEDTFNTAPANMSIYKGGDTPLNLLISALDQSSGTDVLSAPRIVTKSGEEATFRAGELHYYPDSYESNASGGTIVYINYVDWEEKLLGVELSVTPQIDGEQIELDLNPKITELQGMQNYQVIPANSAYTWYQDGVSELFNHDPLVARLPIFRKREVETQVTIADGATIGMGGLISEKVESYEDKVPLLGSLPLVGRLFRNEGERAVKRNLMMFVTAKKVEPSGRVNTARSFE